MANRRCYYTYIVTNALRTVLYTGVTNNMKARLLEHYNGLSKFTSEYGVHFLLYYEVSPYILNAIRREKEIKGWKREKKMALINRMNPELKFLNERFFPSWPPPEGWLLR